jgi:hypothetical protein
MLGGELLDGKGDGGVVEADRHVHAAGVEPLAGNVGSDIRFVLMVGEHDFHRLAEHGAAGILYRHARGRDGARTARIGVET